MIAGIVAGFNLIMLAANTAIASSDLFGFGPDNLKQTDGRERTRVAGPGHPFSFMAMDICNEDTDTCFKLWGSGYFNTDRDQITASGSFEKSVDAVQLLSSRWLAVDLKGGSDTYVAFKASTSRGVIHIMVDEGDRRRSAEVCMYGELIGIVTPESALCTENVRINIR
jgi:hypothetical protein